MTITACDAAIAALEQQLHQQQQPQQQQHDTTEIDPADFDPYLESRADFARLLTTWMKANGWSQQTPAQIAVAAGFRHLSVHNSQVSQAQNCKLDPKPKFFACLETLNALVADTSWMAHKTLPTRLRDTLQQPRPLQHADGTLWTAVDFFAAFAGAPAR